MLVHFFKPGKVSGREESLLGLFCQSSTPHSTNDVFWPFVSKHLAYWKHPICLCSAALLSGIIDYQEENVCWSGSGSLPVEENISGSGRLPKATTTEKRWCGEKIRSLSFYAFLSPSGMPPSLLVQVGKFCWKGLGATEVQHWMDIEKELK